MAGKGTQTMASVKMITPLPSVTLHLTLQFLLIQHVTQQQDTHIAISGQRICVNNQLAQTCMHPKPLPCVRKRSINMSRTRRRPGCSNHHATEPPKGNV